MTGKTRTPIPRRIRVGSKQYSIDIVETMLFALERPRHVRIVSALTLGVSLGAAPTGEAA